MCSWGDGVGRERGREKTESICEHIINKIFPGNILQDFRVKEKKKWPLFPTKLVFSGKKLGKKSDY